MELAKKPVELIELFYDLLFVYAISQLTDLINEPIGGIIPPYDFFSYFVTCFVILQAWLYFTNYVNRYGKWKWYDYVLVCINMIAVIFMSNTILGDWAVMYFTYDVAMLIILLTVAFLYVIQARKEQTLKNLRTRISTECKDCALFVTHMSLRLSDHARDASQTKTSEKNETLEIDTIYTETKNS